MLIINQCFALNQVGKTMTGEKRKKNPPWGIAEDSTQVVAQRQVQKAEIPSDSEMRFGDKPL